MKNLLFLMAITLSLPLMAQQNLNNSQVNVTGEGIVKIAPDEVVIKSRIEHEGNSAAQVKAQNDEVVNKVIKYLKNAGVDEKNIKTDYINLNKRYNYNEKTYSYAANQAISITLKDINNYEQIMKGLLENGLNRIDGVEFKSSEMEIHEKEARKMAVLDAQNKARELVVPLNQQIGKAISISEMEYNTIQPMYRMMDEAVAMSKGEETVAPGQLEIKIRVNVGFELN